MATIKSDIVTARETLALSAAQHSTGELVLFLPCVIDLGSTLAADDVLELGYLPTGAILDPRLSRIACGNPGTALVLDIGDDDDPDRYADGMTLSSGGQVGFVDGTTMPDGLINPVRATEHTLVKATVVTATSITASTKLYCLLAFRIRG